MPALEILPRHQWTKTEWKFELTLREEKGKIFGDNIINTGANLSRIHFSHHSTPMQHI